MTCLARTFYKAGDVMDETVFGVATWGAKEPGSPDAPDRYDNSCSHPHEVAAEVMISDCARCLWFRERFIREGK